MGVSRRSADRGSKPDDFASAILASSQVLVQRSVQCLESLSPGLSFSEFQVLVLLAEQGPKRLMDIATALEVTPTTATRVADRLASRALVDRVRQSTDRREVHLSIAAAGRSLVGAVHSRRRRFISSALGHFSEQDQDAALAVLIHLAEYVDQNEQEKEPA